MTTTLQRVRQLQEEIRAREAMLNELSQQPEYLAEQAFIQDVLDVLEMHGRTLKEAVLAIDPSLLPSAPTAKPKRVYKPRKAVDVEPFNQKASTPPAPRVSPFASFGMAEVADTHPENPKQLLDAITDLASAKPEAKKPAKAKRTQSSKNAKRNAARRLIMISEGRWFLYTNPHTGETQEAGRQDSDTLRAWAAEYGKVVVEGWKRPVTPEEAGIA